MTARAVNMAMGNFFCAPVPHSNYLNLIMECFPGIGMIEIYIRIKFPHLNKEYPFRSCLRLHCGNHSR